MLALFLPHEGEINDKNMPEPCCEMRAPKTGPN